ncbi:23S rRNA (uracil(1939)-C(5))-methyltransferase RlmD [uncultured Pseudoteredinibacter sp.]|uniref:23S rRNA (uracil(1939)-C(5))-methyltransferase RlmD n=1 Tax=uncultured Pseudoteredinibacter sp. TaxID=1641701 RepID=UPI0026380B07|nr:23S rRNA (uracil(1939)-C(5))-methyltransferase RlmD [uncultured Pseudoteredinibacter sp.]
MRFAFTSRCSAMSRSAHFSRLKTAKSFSNKSKLAGQPSQELLLDVVRLDDEGNGIAKAPIGGLNQTTDIKIPFSLPGERCLVNYVEGSDSAELVELVRHSQQRQEPPCEHFAHCGGCQLQHMTYSRQLEFKRDRMWAGLQGLLNLKSQATKSKVKPKLGKKPASKASIPSVIQTRLKCREDISLLSCDPFEYRRRARLGISKGGQLGFRRANSNDTISLGNCLNLSSNLQQVMQSLNEFFIRHKDVPWSKHVGHVELLDVAPSPLILMRLVMPVADKVFAELNDLIAARNWRLAVQSEKSGNYTPHQGLLNSYYPLHGLDIVFEPGKFIQINDSLNQAMVSQALSWLTLEGTERLLDLFCGTGNFSLTFAQHAGQVLGVELSPEMVAIAAQNAADLGIENVEFVAANLDAGESFLRAHEKLAQAKPDIVVLDPPRAGAAGFIPTLLELSPQRILYISCHQGSFLRDLRKLGGASYRLEKLSVMDMFPNTEHVECMALLSR